MLRRDHCYARSKQLKILTDLAQPFDHPTLPDAIVFLSIRYYTKSCRILKAVLDAGFSVDQRMYHELGGGGEKSCMTALFWALSLPEDTVNEAVIETLISYKGERGIRLDTLTLC